jgi:hypothetical protein
MVSGICQEEVDRHQGCFKLFFAGNRQEGLPNPQVRFGTARRSSTNNVRFQTVPTNYSSQIVKSGTEVVDLTIPHKRTKFAPNLICTL